MRWRHDDDDDRPRGRTVTYSEFHRALAHVHERIDELSMTEQADINALTDQASQIAASLDAARTSLQNEIDSLAQAHPDLDLSALRAGLDNLGQHVNSLSQIAPSGASGPPAASGPGETPSPGASGTGPDQAVYTHAGDASAIDASVFPSAPYSTSDGQALYYFAGDPTTTDVAAAGFTEYTGDVTATG